ncbi:MAG: FHA domain-containing protein [Gemmataceae bacterium]|nr:FHA domain-containing protein [Gemmataceae bacterium]
MAGPGSHDDLGLPPGTRIESVEAIRRAHQARSATRLEAAPVPEPQPWRPSRRPPLGLLCALDDGSDEGEWVRLRCTPFVIGRTSGDLLIPHDDLVSGRHLEITRKHGPGGWRWVLADLGSTNGTFVRVASLRLKHEGELLLAGRRYRFDEAGPALVEVLPEGDGPRYPLEAGQDAGRDPARCAVLIDDPFLDPVHARIARDPEGWALSAASTLNGTWLRVARANVGNACHFQVGEQRFLLRSC